MDQTEKNGYTFISGATGGIGKAFAFECVNQGPLFLTGRNEKKLLQLKDQLLQENPEAIVDFFACDLSDEIQREDMFRYINDKTIRIGRLFCIAGIDTQKALVRYTQEKLVRQIRVNFEASASLALFAVKNRAEHLDIAVLSSICGEYPMPYFAAYSATKGAMTSFFKSLHSELKGSSVNVTVVAPNGVYTRPDVCEYIKSEGLWGKISAKSPQYIAKKTLKAVQKNKMIVYPGFWNKVVAFVPKLLPSRLRLAIIAKRWKRMEKDAF